jgi:hypothetical protein
MVLPAMTAGLITFYARGVMEEVYRNRLTWKQVAPCPECVGMAAVLDCGRLGDRVWLAGPDGWEGPFLVVDCSNAAHLAAQRARGLMAEVSWEQAQEWHMRGPIEGRVSWAEPTARQNLEHLAE